MAEIRSQEQYEKVKAALKAGKFSDNDKQEKEILEAALAWKESQFGATSGMSGIDKFLAGTGKGFSDVALGAKQRASDIANLLPLSPMSAAASGSRDALQEEAQNRQERDAPLLKTKAGMGGNIFGHMAVTAPLGGAITSIPRAIGLGAAEGALLPTTDEGQLASNIGVGGALGAGGQLAARGLGRAFRPVQRSLSNRGEDAVNLLRREGVNLDVAQRTGSETAQRLRSGLNDNPLTANRATRFTENQRRQFTRAVLRRIGVESDEATAPVLNRATRQIGQQIDDALDSTPPVFDTELARGLGRIQRAIDGQLTEADARPLLRNIEEIIRNTDPGDNIITPAIFRRVRSNLSALRSKPGVGQLASEFEDELLGSLQRAGGDREGLRRAIAQWRNWKIIENSIDKGTDKYISPLRLSNTFGTKQNRAVSLRHLGHPETVELSQLADAGRAVLPETLGNSGTTPRALMSDLMLAVGGAGGAAATGADVGTAAAAGVGALTLPMILQRAMLSQGGVGNYLTQGILPGAQNAVNSPLTQSLIRQGIISQGLIGE